MTCARDGCEYVFGTVVCAQLCGARDLALTMLVYPGATQRRFEHCLGVMELTGKVFDVITKEVRVTDRIKSPLPELRNRDKPSYWRQVVRVAALCHDLGHHEAHR